MIVIKIKTIKIYIYIKNSDGSVKKIQNTKYKIQKNNNDGSSRGPAGDWVIDYSPLKKNTTCCDILQLQQQIFVCDILSRWYMGCLVKGTKYGVVS